jgi:hypothetical protein
MGGETEYAISARHRNGQVIPQGRLLARCWEHARLTLGYSSASTRGRFLRNGGLIYLDAGLHLEWGSPETTSPFEVVRYLAAGDRIVHDVVRSFAAASDDVAEIFCSRANVDYVSQTLWAAHESFRFQGDSADLPGQLIPFLASRVLLGAGGWDVRSPALRFTLSPRAHFISRLADRDSQHVRPLFHTKDEPLGPPGDHRLHVACGESLCSQRANVLRFGTTALVLALVERGVRPGDDLALVSPITAVQRFATDPTCQATVPLVSGDSLTAIGLQRRYLECVEAHVDALPFPWAGEVCALWRETLDDLEAGGSRAAGWLDWAIKRRLFVRCLDRRGIPWAALSGWHTVFRHLQRRLANGASDVGAFNWAFVLNPTARIREQMDRLTPVLERRGLSWDDLPALARARQEVFELDARFGALGEDGVFDALDRAGALNHRVRDLDVADAVLNPPQDTRARIRGDVVRRLSEEGTVYAAEWTSVYDKDRNRELLLSDPLTTEEYWREPPERSMLDQFLAARA